VRHHHPEMPTVLRAHLHRTVTRALSICEPSLPLINPNLYQLHLGVERIGIASRLNQVSGFIQTTDCKAMLCNMCQNSRVIRR
jgi:hypothetical protein